MSKIITNSLPGSVKKSPKLHLFAATIFFIAAIFSTAISIAQSPKTPADCRSGCTSNDVQIVRAYLSNINGTALGSDYVCGSGDVYLSLVLSTNTPRIGVSIYTDIYTWDAAQQKPGANTNHPVSQCFGDNLKGNNNIVTFQTPIVWDCQPIVLMNTYTAWGTGNTNFCTGSAFQCGGTPSKCHSLLPGQFIPIETPSTTPASGSKCSEVAGSYQASFDLTSFESSMVSTPGSYNFTFFTNIDMASNHQITDPTSYTAVAASTTIYVHVCDKAHTDACSNETITLTVNPKPGLPSFTLTQPTLCGTSTGSINICQTASGMDYKLGTTIISGDGSAKAFTSLAAGSNPKFVVIDHTTGCVSDTFSCANALADCPTASASLSQRTTVTTHEPQQTLPTVKAYPNPFDNKVTFEVNVATAGDASLEIYNAMGQKLKTVYQGHLNAGKQLFELAMPKQQQATLIYVFRSGDKKISGKLLQINK